MDTLMCQGNTGKAAAGRLAAILAMAALTASAQTTADAIRPAWRRIGGPAFEMALAAPATGPVAGDASDSSIADPPTRRQ